MLTWVWVFDVFVVLYWLYSLHTMSELPPKWLSLNKKMFWLKWYHNFVWIIKYAFYLIFDKMDSFSLNFFHFFVWTFSQARCNSKIKKKKYMKKLGSFPHPIFGYFSHEYEKLKYLKYLHWYFDIGFGVM